MNKKFKIDGQILHAADMTELAIDVAHKIEYVDKRLKDYKRTEDLLSCARKSYIKSLKQGLIADKAGLMLNN
tara:strand:+ start:339 stop:554 length:216 start_codon:yes stop_codon:yes gene_type:complete